MKYLKEYKIFESTDDVMNDIHDILLELKDIGFSVNVSKYDVTIEKYIDHQPILFKCEGDLLEAINRIKEYLGKGKMSSIGLMTDHYVWLDFDKYIQLKNPAPIRTLKFNYS